MREAIIGEIRRIAAAKGGRPPGQKAFFTQTGIAQHKWSGVYWSKWSDALIEAGFSANEWTKRLDTSELVEKFASLTVALGHLPTTREIQILRRQDTSVPSQRVIIEHFNGQDGLIEALRDLAFQNATYQALHGLLPSPKLEPRRSRSIVQDGSVYLIRSGDYYKIGRSDEIERRVKEIKIALPDKAILLHTIQTDDPSGIEAYWHRRFADRRANGEWFRLSAEDVKAFQRRKFQ